MERKIILLIDDESDFCSLVKTSLERTGAYIVETAMTGIEGLNKAENIKPDLILLDIIMPGMDGIKILDKLKKNTETMSIPVVMLTAKDDDLSKMKSSELFDEDYIAKPVDTKEITERIEKVLQRRGLT